MNRQVNIVAALLAFAIFGASCGQSAQPLQPAAQATALYGSTLEGVTVVTEGSLVTVSLAELPTSGQFIGLSLPDGVDNLAESWEGDDGVLRIAAPVAGGVEIGAVPTADYVGQPVSLRLKLQPADRTASTPPTGQRNVVTDLIVTDIGGGMVALEWTQINNGDYDFNGEVNAADLVPIAAKYLSTVNRGAAGAELLPEFWIDGDANGEINAADIVPIASNYRVQLAGYNVRHNGTRMPGGTAAEPTVLRTAAQPRTGLPPRYRLEVAGSPADTWTVTAVDPAGVEGADSTGDPGGGGSPQIVARLDIVGIDLYELGQGGNPGPFGPGKLSSRIIDPIDIVNRFSVGTAELDGTTVSFSGVPVGRTYMIDFLYQPTVDPGTGEPRSGSGLKGSSALDDAVISSVPVTLPAGEDTPVEVETEIEYEDNPDGPGYLVTLTTTIWMPGDNPDTPAVEDGYLIERTTRLDYAAGLVSEDTDRNGLFDDEPSLNDTDRDCVSEQRTIFMAKRNDDDDDGPEFSVEGTLSEFNEAEGYLTLTNAVPDDGAGEFTVPSTVTIEFDESANFERRIRTDDDRVEEDMDPSELALGAEMEVYLYSFVNETGETIVTLWAQTVREDIDLRTDD